MRAVVITKPGGPEVLEIREVPSLEPGPSDVRVRVRATAVNRADLLQRMGLYPAPPGAPADIPGLEIAGEVDAVGRDVTELREGDRVFGVVAGGGYADQIVVHARTLAKLPASVTFTDGAAMPEAFVTAYDALVLQGGLAAGERALIHAAGSGVGTAAVQICRAIGASSIGTARTEAKLGRAEALGASACFAPAVENGAPRFAARVHELTEGRGVDVVLDLVGGAYTPESLASLAPLGRLVLVGLLAGVRAEIDLGLVLRKRLRLFGTVLRARPLEEKILAAQCLSQNLAPLFASGALHAVVDRVLPLEKAAEAHAHLAANEGFGKIVLSTDGVER